MNVNVPDKADSFSILTIDLAHSTVANCNNRLRKVVRIWITAMLFQPLAIWFRFTMRSFLSSARW